jgi:hypothetical protein
LAKFSETVVLALEAITPPLMMLDLDKEMIHFSQIIIINKEEIHLTRWRENCLEGSVEWAVDKVMVFLQGLVESEDKDKVGSREDLIA